MATEVPAEVPSIWPEPFVEDFNDPNWPNLGLGNDEIEKWVLENKQVMVRTVTWNLCAKPPPNKDAIVNTTIPLNKFHVYVVGTEECERSIAQSAINPSKKNWEAYLRDAIGPRYKPLRSHTLQAIHIMVFVHEAIAHMCNVATSAAVAFGVGNTLGNKGAVGLLLRIGSSRLIVVNAHLSAHQNSVKQRNAEFHKINGLMPALLLKKESFYNGAAGGKLSLPLPETTLTSATKDTPSPMVPSAPISSVDASNQAATDEVLQKPADEPSDANKGEVVAANPESGAVTESDLALLNPDSTANTIEPEGNDASKAKTPGNNDEDSDDGEEDPEPASPMPTNVEGAGNVILASKTLDQIADAVIFMGDLNYRIKGNRSVIDKLLSANMHEVMLSNDQLKTSMQAGLSFQKFTEAPLHFKPTYKFDLNSDVYDSGSKQRIPSWTDRILFVPNDNITCLAYNSDSSIKTSDHRPVYASFLVRVNTYVELNELQKAVLPTKGHVKYTSESQVCTVS
eukprot:gene27507-33224_t